MKTKLILKWGSISLLVVAIIVLGVILLQKISHDKEVFDKDLHKYIPAETSLLLQINKPKDIANYAPMFTNLQAVLMRLNASVTYPLIVTGADVDYFLLARVTSQQENDIRKILESELFASFPPKIRKYKDADLLFYPTDQDAFFVCMFYKGIFVGGYDYKYLEKMVDTEGSINNIFSNSSIKGLLINAKPNYSSNIVLNENNQAYVFNVEQRNSEMELLGTSAVSFTTSWACQTVSDTLSIDYSLFPDVLLAYDVVKNDCPLSDTLMCMFDAPTYRFIIDENSQPVYVIKHNNSKFAVYDLLNDLERKYIGRKFSTRDVILGNQHIYTTSLAMAKDIFEQESVVSLAFYNKCLVFSTSRQSLINYLKANGNFKGNRLDDSDASIENIISVSVSNDLSRYYQHNLGSLSFLQNHFKSIHVINSISEGEHKINISLNK